MEPTALSASPSPRHWHCERCQRWVLPRRPHWGWRVTEVCFWLSVPFALFVLKGFGVVVMPFIFLFAGGLAGPLRQRAGVDPHCPECDCSIYAPNLRA